jgi:hypothetical protein
MDLIEIGRIARLQVQTASLKVGTGRERYYDPAPLRSVDVFRVSGAGVSLDGPAGPLLDIHHAHHPLSKNRDTTNGVSVGFTSHYQHMRSRFGDHLPDGIAGENILVESGRQWDLADLAGGLVIVGADGREVMLVDISVAHPCVEFSRFAQNDRAAAPQVVSDVLRFLDNGVRGFYARVPSDEPLRVAVGDRLLLRGGTF